jgi:hypothetical protein
MSILEVLPQGFSSNTTNSSWAFYSTVGSASLPGDFNRTLFVAPWFSNVTDKNLSQRYV